MYSSDILFLWSREGYFGVYFPELRSNEENKQQNNTRVSAETVHHSSTYIILFLTRQNESTNDDKTTIFTHRSRVSLTWFSFWWWCHNWLLMTSQWPDNCDAIAWIAICNTLDIDFIHGDIHGRSCKKLSYLIDLCHHWFRSSWLDNCKAPSCQAPSHYLSQWWPKWMLPYSITRPQWVNISPLQWTEII